jgi:hypothetical protein
VRTLTLKHSLPDTLNPFAEDPMLTTRFEEWKAGVEARGEARGEAKGKVQTIIELAESGDVSRAIARLRLQHLAEQGQASHELVNAGIARLAD